MIHIYIHLIHLKPNVRQYHILSKSYFDHKYYILEDNFNINFQLEHIFSYKSIKMFRYLLTNYLMYHKQYNFVYLNMLNNHRFHKLDKYYFVQRKQIDKDIVHLLILYFHFINIFYKYLQYHIKHNYQQTHYIIDKYRYHQYKIQFSIYKHYL